MEYPSQMSFYLDDRVYWFLGIWARGDSQGLDKKWILAALVLFLLADGFLEVQFFLGMGVFAAGHLILIGWFLTRGAYTPVSFSGGCSLWEFPYICSTGN